MSWLKRAAARLLGRLEPIHPVIVGVLKRVTAFPNIGPHIAPGAGSLLIRLGKIDQAIELLSAVSASDEVMVRLGRAYEVRGAADRALDAYLHVLDRNPEHLDALRRTGKILAAERRWEDALDWLERAVVLEPRDWRLRDQLGRCYSNVRDWYAASYQFEGAQRLAPLEAALNARLAKALSRTRRYEEYRALRNAAELSPETVRYWTDLGDLLLSVGARDAAQRVFSRATRIDPAQEPPPRPRTVRRLHRGRLTGERARTPQAPNRRTTAQQYAALGLAFLGDKRPTVAYDATLGITTRSVGRLADADAAFSAAIDLDPSRAWWRARLAQTRLTRRDHPGVVLAMERAIADGAGSAKHYHTLGKAYQHPSVRSFGRALQAYEAALEQDPTYRPAAERLIRLSARTQRWGSAWTVAEERLVDRNGVPLKRRMPSDLRSAVADLFTSEAVGRDVSFIVTRVSNHLASGGTLDQEALRLIATRLSAAGHFELSWDVRSWSAELTAKRPIKKSMGRGDATAAVKALQFLGRLTDQHVAKAAAAANEGRMSSGLARKWSADLALIRGDVTKLVSFAEYRRANLPLAGDRRFRSLIEGRRVAVVGPSDTGEENGPEIDGFDTVIRPRFQPEFVEANAHLCGSRTDISYYSGHDLTEMADALDGYLRSGHLQQVVARPLMYRPGFTVTDDPEGLRFYRDEFSLYYEALPLGIQRIIYDVLQFSPAQVKVFNTDFYTGAVRFMPGYRDPKDYEVAENSLLNDVFSSHDLGQDFDLVRALHLSSLVTLDRMGTELLALGRSRYLQRLEALGTF